MSTIRAELRAYPRLSWAHPARVELLGLSQAAQVADLSQGGCKLLPSDLKALAVIDLRPGITIRVEVDDLILEGTVRWATPNFSALGCSFETILSPEDLARLGLQLRAR